MYKRQFLALITLSGSGLVAGNWQAEVGVPNAPPTFVGPAPPQAAGVIDCLLYTSAAARGP